MKESILRVLRLLAGLFLFATGIVMTINANLGLAPWDVFHQGISKILNITIGQASIGVGVILIVLNSFFGERLGWGTILNMLLIGLFIDLLMLNNIIPVSNSFFSGFIMAMLGMFVIGIASFLYIGAGLGSGPRDGLMVALTKKTGKSVRFIRNFIETSVLVIGYLLGGHVGIGTVLMSLCIGYFVQFAFKICRFDVNAVEHRFIDQDIKFLKEIIINKRESKDTDIS